MNSETKSMLASSLLAAIVALAVSVIGGLVSINIASREGTRQLRMHETDTGVRMVEIAIGILSTPPDENTKPLRKWAVDLLSTYAPINVPLDEESKSALLEYKLNLGWGRSTWGPAIGEGPIGEGPIGR